MIYDRDTLRRELERDEGFRSRPYRDTVGKLTVGIGRNLDDVGIHAAETARLGITTASVRRTGVDRATAYQMLDSDIALCERDLDRHAPWWRSMTDNRQRVLLNMCFNMGWPVLSQFKNTLRYMQQGQYERAAANMLLSKWAGQVGVRALRLADLMRVG